MTNQIIMSNNGGHPHAEGQGEKMVKRGFAAMDPGVHRVVSRKGGKVVHKKGKGHRFTPEEASAAGHKSGRSVSGDKVQMARIGRKGGEASGDQRRADWLSRFDIEEDDDRKSSERERRQ